MVRKTTSTVHIAISLALRIAKLALGTLGLGMVLVLRMLVMRSLFAMLFPRLRIMAQAAVSRQCSSPLQGQKQHQENKHHLAHASQCIANQ